MNDEGWEQFRRGLDGMIEVLDILIHQVGQHGGMDWRQAAALSEELTAYRALMLDGHETASATSAEAGAVMDEDVELKRLILRAIGMRDDQYVLASVEDAMYLANQYGYDVEITIRPGEGALWFNGEQVSRGDG